MSSRRVSRIPAGACVRAAVTTATVGLTAVAIGLLAALPASAVEGLGTKEPSGLSKLDTFLIFVGIPMLVFAVVIALVYGTSRKSEPRLREGQAWWSEPEYHSGDATTDATTTDGIGADASRTTDGGGSGASW